MGVNLLAYSQGRDNNFNLIRLVAAYAVLISHSFVLATGQAQLEPFTASLGVTLGSIAVDVFFLISGFLVTGSLVRKRNLREFAWARALRIFPGLLVMLALTVFVLGAALSTMPWSRYVTDERTWQYLLKNITLVTGIGKGLPGLFADNPFPEAVNGSLWTLKYEIRMYASLGLGWFVFTRIGWLGERKLRVGVLGVAVLAGCMHVGACLALWSYRPSVQLSFMFFSGAAWFLWREHIRLTLPLFGGAVLVIVLGVLLPLKIFPVVYALTLPYLVFYLAYVPHGAIRAYNRVGDYSYGIYIYAFPVQQAVATCWPHAGVGGMIVLATILVAPLAILSWHWIEKPGMAIRQRRRSVPAI